MKLRTKKKQNKEIVLPQGLGKLLTVTAKIITLFVILFYIFAKFYVVITTPNAIAYAWFSENEAKGLFWVIMLLFLIVLPIDISIVVKNFFNIKGGDNGS